MTMMMMMDAHFSQKEETARKIKTRRKRAKETRKRDVKKKRVVCLYLSTIRTFFMRHFERNFGRKTRDSWLHDEELFTVARSNQERRVCVLFSQRRIA